MANPDPAPAAAPEDVGGMPDWAIAVVVIGLGSFAFVLVFGITVVSGNPTVILACFICFCAAFHRNFCIPEISVPLTTEISAKADETS